MAPLASIDLTLPVTMAPLSLIAVKLVNGSASICLMPREIRSRSTSMANTTASSSSPFLKFLTASSPATFQDKSDKCTRPSILPGKPMKTPKSVIDLIVPLTFSPFLCDIENSSHGFARHCFMPSEMRRRSSSISRIMTSTSSPSETTFAGCTFLLVQSISETCTRPSIPLSISMNAP